MHTPMDSETACLCPCGHPDVCLLTEAYSLVSSWTTHCSHSCLTLHSSDCPLTQGLPFLCPAHVLLLLGDSLPYHPLLQFCPAPQLAAPSTACSHWDVCHADCLMCALFYRMLGILSEHVLYYPIAFQAQLPVRWKEMSTGCWDAHLLSPTWELEAGGSGIQGQPTSGIWGNPGQYFGTLSQNSTDVSSLGEKKTEREEKWKSP